MKKKIFGTLALAAVASLSLAGCGGGSSNNNTADGYIDAIILYKNNNGMTYRDSTASTLLDGTRYQQGDLLPMWKELEKKFDVKFRDAADYSQKSTKDAVNKYKQDGYKGKDNQNVELVMSTNSLTREMANEHKLLSLSDNLDKMPNFKAYLESHPSVAAQLYQADGHIYNTPYFDGVDAVEKYFMMNTEYIKKLLDDEYPVSSMDTDTTITSAYTPFYSDMAGQKLLVTNAAGTDAQVLTVGDASYNSAIEAQNAKGTLNGQNAVQALRDYIDEAYMAGNEDLYENRSDVFVSASACYNVDDLVALFRCVKANPKYLCGEDSINVFFPRSGEANRERQVMELISFFGVRGISSESEKLYFDKNGELQDMRIQRSTYEAIQKLNQIYQEGLIVQNYEAGFGGDAKSEWRASLLQAGTGFASYDYTGTTSPYVDTPYQESDKTGSKSYGAFNAVLPPVAKWDVSVDPDGKALEAPYFHFSEDSRALKDGGWVIPADADPDLVDKCLAIMDYMFCDEGADLQDYGPNTTNFRAKVIEYDENGKRVTTSQKDPEALMSLNGKDCVIIADAVFEDMDARGVNWNDYYRRYVGSTQGIGHIRSDGLDYQTTCQSLKDGMKNVETAIQAGSMFICTTESQGTFYSCAPSSYAISAADQEQIDQNCSYMKELWAEDSSSASTGYTKLITTAAEITNAAINTILASGNVDPVNQYYLKFYRDAYTKSLEYIK